jgi:hypothetical protein
VIQRGQVAIVVQQGGHIGETGMCSVMGWGWCNAGGGCGSGWHIKTSLGSCMCNLEVLGWG